MISQRASQLKGACSLMQQGLVDTQFCSPGETQSARLHRVAYKGSAGLPPRWKRRPLKGKLRGEGLNLSSHLYYRTLFQECTIGTIYHWQSGALHTRRRWSSLGQITNSGKVNNLPPFQSCTNSPFIVHNTSEPVTYQVICHFV